MLGLDTKFVGDIRFKGTLRIDGTVEGSIIAKEGVGSILVINQHASVAGNIVSDSVLIGGEVTGHIKAVERVEIYRTGSLKGDVYTGDILIEAGGEFEGRCRMIQNMNQEQRDKIMGIIFPPKREQAKSRAKVAPRRPAGGQRPGKASG